MNKKIRILHFVPGLDKGGVAQVIYNHYIHFNKNIFMFDFATFSKEVGYIETKFLEMGSKIHHITPKKVSFLKFNKEVNSILKDNNYDIVHVHSNHMSFFPLFLALKHKINVRIAHSHQYIKNPSLFQFITRSIGMNLNKITMTHAISCGKAAGEWIFGKKYVKEGKVFFLYNAVDLSQFVYNLENSKKIRKQLSLESQFIIGHIGRIETEKNPYFILDIFNEILNLNPNSILVWVGEGSMKNEIKNKSLSLNISEKIIFLGQRNDVNQLLSIFDVFLLPSFSEGFPVVIVEALANGLKCFVSTEISSEIAYKDLVIFLELSKGSKFWAEFIIENACYVRESDIMEMKLKGFELEDSALKLQEFYLEKLN